MLVNLKEILEIAEREKCAIGMFNATGFDSLQAVIGAAEEKGVKTITVGGGVAANDYLRTSLAKECKKRGFTLVLPEKRYCTDNAAMIASEGLVQFRLGNFAEMDLTAKASIPLAATLETVQSRAAKKAEQR